MRAALEQRTLNSGGPDARSAPWGSKCVGARLVATAHAAAAMHLAMMAHARALSTDATEGHPGSPDPHGTAGFPGSRGRPPAEDAR